MKIVAIKNKEALWKKYGSDNNIPARLYVECVGKEDYMVFIKDNRLLLKMTKLWSAGDVWVDSATWEEYLFG